MIGGEWVPLCLPLGENHFSRYDSAIDAPGLKAACVSGESSNSNWLDWPVLILPDTEQRGCHVVTQVEPGSRAWSSGT